MHPAKHFPLILVLVCHTLVAQDWKTLYDQGKQAYDAGQYDQALASAEKAYELAKNTDAKTSAYTLQLLTVISLDGGFASKALGWSDEEIKKFLELEGTNSRHYYEALHKQAQLIQLSGQLPLAVEKHAALPPLAGKIYGPESYEYYTAFSSYGQVLMEAGSFAQSQEVWNKCLPKLKQLPDASEDYFYGLYYAAFVDHQLGTSQEAYRKWTEFVSIADQNNLQNLEEYKQAKNFLAELQRKGLNANTTSSDGKTIQQHLTAALDYQNKKQWDLAATEYALVEKSISPENMYSLPAFTHYLNFGRLLYQQRRYADAALKLTESRKIAEKLFPPTAPEHGHIQYLEGELKLAEGKAPEAQQVYLNAFANLKSASPEVQATYLINASRAMLTAGHPQFSLALMQPIVTTNGIPGADEKHQLGLITTYCDALELLNRNEDAVSYLKAKITVATANSKATLQVKLAEALKESGQWQEAASLVQKVLKSPALPAEIKAEASYQLARTQQQLGQHVPAEKNYLTALELYRQVNPENALQVSNSLATFYTQLGNYEAAENIYTSALSSVPANSTFSNTLKQNLAAIYQQTKRLKEAEQLLEAVVQSEKGSGNVSPEYAISLQNLAALHQRAGDYAKAKALYEQALDIDRKYSGEQSLSYATKMANLATVCAESGELPKARTLYESALKIRAAKLGTEHPDYVFNEYNLAVLYHRMQEYSLARPLYKKIGVFYIQQINELFPAMSEQEKTAFYNKIQEVITAYEDFAVEFASTDKNILSELLDFRLQTKALLLNASAGMRNRILASGDPVLIEKFTQWLQTKEQLALIFSLPAEERAARKPIADALQQKANTAEKELSAKSELFASSTGKKSSSWRKLQVLLKPGEAMMEMMRLRLNLKNDSVIYAALIVKPGTQVPDMVILPKGRAMELREFAYYRNNIRFLLTNERSYQVYWKALEPYLGGINTLYLSPDGVYNKVNASTLFDPEKQQYLIDRISVKLVSNLRDLSMKPNAMPAAPQAVLMGYPDYLQNAKEDHTYLTASAGKSSTAFELVRGGLDPLPATKTEVQKVEKLLKDHQWNVRLHLFEAATEEVIKAQRSPALLHVATHGFFINTPKKEGEVVYSQSVLHAESNPLLRSGLMLAGAEKNLVSQVIGKPGNITSEDGVFTAYEAMNMNLQNTDLVVLSACETGAGEVRNGEGVYGLQRSFLVAGANSVMMSLWKVNDEATQELMVLFYSNWLDSKDKRKAFYQTQLELKKRYADPYYWGPFVMIGQ